jgi:hypothetical protein
VCIEWSVLHVLNGDATRFQLERSTVGGVATVWADVLHDGPTPAGLAADEFRQARARHLAARFGQPQPDVLAQLQAWDAALDRYHEHDEVVFWFEHDLFDQLILIRHLHWLSTIDPGTTRFSLICIGAFPGIENFNGLGQLSASQLATLMVQRQPITDEQIQVGRQAWDLFRADDPEPLQAWLQDGVQALPFLAGAMRRHFEDYPSTRDGLARTERQMLVAIAEGHDTFAAMFRAGQLMEERVYMGDATFLAILKDLADARTPLVTIGNHVQLNSARSVIHRTPVQLTGAGRAVLDGNANHVELNGIDRWMGGVHLTTERCWRSDGEAIIPRAPLTRSRD